MATNTLKKITSRAKQLRKKRPGISWKSAVKSAGLEYRQGKIGKAKRKASPKKKTPAKRKRVGAAKKKTTTQKKVEISVGTVAGHMGAAKKMLLDDIGRKDAQIFAATKKSVKNKLRKQLTKLKAQYRRVAC
jgi:hypothetical protein